MTPPPTQQSADCEAVPVQEILRKEPSMPALFAGGPCPSPSPRIRKGLTAEMEERQELHEGLEGALLGRAGRLCGCRGEDRAALKARHGGRERGGQERVTGGCSPRESCPNAYKSSMASRFPARPPLSGSVWWPSAWGRGREEKAGLSPVGWEAAAPLESWLHYAAPLAPGGKSSEAAGFSF